jgi:hypothetical protein
MGRDQALQLEFTLLAELTGRLGVAKKSTKPLGVFEAGVMLVDVAQDENVLLNLEGEAYVLV